MKVIRYIIKTVLWSLGISIGIRIVFGLYSVFGPVTLIIPAALGIIASVSLATSGNGSFMAVSVFHIMSTTALYIFFDYSGIFRMLASDTADFFADLAGRTDSGVNLLWCILFVLPVYFFFFIVSSGIGAAVRNRRMYRDRNMSMNDDNNCNDNDFSYIK